MSLKSHVAVFWDYENCRPPSNASGYAVVDGILKSIKHLGSIILFKAYVELTLNTPNSKSMLLHSELQSSGVSLTHCPHNGRKDVADKMMIADMLAFAIDNPTPATVVIITGDRDFAYAASLLKLRGYVVVLIVPLPAHMSLKMQATTIIDWQREVLGCAQLQRERVLGTECPIAAVNSPKNLPISAIPMNSGKPSDSTAGPTTSQLIEPRITGSTADGSSNELRSKVDVNTSVPSSSSSQIPGHPSQLVNIPQDETLSHLSTRSPPILSESPLTPTSIDSYESRACGILLSPLKFQASRDGQWESRVNDSQSLSENIESDCRAYKGTLREVTLKGFHPFHPRQTEIPPLSVSDDNWTWWDRHGDHDLANDAQPESICLEPLPTAVGVVRDHIPAPATGKFSDNYSQFATSATTSSGVSSSITCEYTQALAEQSSEASVQSTYPLGQGAPPIKATKILLVQDSINQAFASLQQPIHLFEPLISLLKAHEKEGIFKVDCSQLGSELLAKDKDVYERAGVDKLKTYVEMAISAGLVKATKPGPNGEVWVELSEGLQTNSLRQKFKSSLTTKKPSTKTQQTEDPFKPLITLLSSQGASDGEHMLFSRCGELLQQRKPGIYHAAGVSGFKQYLEKAEDMGVVVLGGSAPRQWVALNPQTRI